jgi:DNA relaxase NicK
MVTEKLLSIPSVTLDGNIVAKDLWLRYKTNLSKARFEYLLPNERKIDILFEDIDYHLGLEPYLEVIAKDMVKGSIFKVKISLKIVTMRKWIKGTIGTLKVDQELCSWMDIWELVKNGTK